MAGIPDGATELGSYFYLFKSSTNFYDCLISAHGGYVRENRTFTVPKGVEICFYGPHGAALIDPNITTFSKSANIAETVNVYGEGDKCINYLLSKYQGKHAGADGKTEVENYEQIVKTVRGEDSYRKKQFELAVRAMKLNNQKGAQGNKAMLLNCWGGSILTVRNRWNVFMGVPLFDAIKAARKEIPTLKRFHAVFCRSNMLGDDLLPSQEVKYNI